MRKMAGEGSGDSAASGLPETTKAHQQLTTDNNGEAVWTDELAYDNSIVYRYDGTMEGKVVSASGGYVRVSEDTPSPEEMIEMRLHMSSESTGEGMRLGDWSYASTEETWHDTMAGFVDVRYKPNSEFPATGIYFATDLLEWWLSKNDIKQ